MRIRIMAAVEVPSSSRRCWQRLVEDIVLVCATCEMLLLASATRRLLKCISYCRFEGNMCSNER